MAHCAQRLAVWAVCFAAACTRAGTVLPSGDHALVFEERSDGTTVLRLLSPVGPGDRHCTFRSDEPFELELVAVDGTVTRHGDPYQSVSRHQGAVVARSTWHSPRGSRFSATDTYHDLDGGGAFRLDRRVIVEAAGDGDIGFSTRYGLRLAAATAFDGLEVFGPGVWLRQQQNVPAHWIGADPEDNVAFFRETRLTSPHLSLHNPGTGQTLTLVHVDADPRTVPGDDFLGRVIDPGMQFGSFGILRDAHPLIGFQFPGSEGEKTPIHGPPGRQRRAPRSHPVTPGVPHAYSLVIAEKRHADFNAAVRGVWRRFYSLEGPHIERDTDIERIYEASIDLLDTVTQRYHGVMGVPFSIDTRTGDVESDSFCMSFVGGQLATAYHLIAYGLRHDRPDTVRKGEEIMDFWTTRSYVFSTGEPPNAQERPALPRYWLNGDNTWRPGGGFTRALAEGHLYALYAWREMKRHDHDRPGWRQWILRYADWLDRNQNRDGSFHRRYNTDDGIPLTPSKTATTHPIRFLIETYRETGRIRYLQTALAAGTYALTHVHAAGAYVGGTPDNPDVPDKEGAILALDAFLALFETTGSKTYLAAAQRAATYAETYTYIRDIPTADGEPRFASADAINTAGMSLVGLGHSYADNYNSCSWLAYYKLHLLTKDPHWFNAAELMLCNTKQKLDLNGTAGLFHPGAQGEGHTVCIKRGLGNPRWLAWCSIVHISPVVEARDLFGMDLFAGNGITRNDPDHRAAYRQHLADTRVESPAAKTLRPTTKPRYIPLTRGLFTIDPNDVGLKNMWHTDEHDASTWRTLELGRPYERQGVTMAPPGTPHPDKDPYNGVSWYRITVRIPSDWHACGTIMVRCDAIDDGDTTFWNGAEIGRTQGHRPKRRYVVPRRLIRFGDTNLLAVRCTDTSWIGGITRPLVIVGTTD